MMVRRYVPSDCARLAALFRQTVHTVNATDYTKEQLDAWAPEALDLAAWDRSFSAHDTVVVLEDGQIVGFGDMDPTGYLDRLYVHKDHQGRGIATAICGELERAAGTDRFTTHASITAKPFFLLRGYRVIREQQVVKNGISLINYVMEKTAGSQAAGTAWEPVSRTAGPVTGAEGLAPGAEIR